MPELTQRQRQVLEFIDLQVRERGYPPTVREIGEAVGLSSSSTVHAHLAALQEKGFLRRDPTKPRAIEVCFEAGSESVVERRPTADHRSGRVDVGAGVQQRVERVDVVGARRPVQRRLLVGARGTRVDAVAGEPSEVASPAPARFRPRPSAFATFPSPRASWASVGPKSPYSSRTIFIARS